MIWIYRTKPSTSARDLALAVGGRRMRRATSVRFLRPEDRLVCWGEEQPAAVPDGVAVINGGVIRSKFVDAEALRAAGVLTIEVARTRPVQPPFAPVDPALAAFQDAYEHAEEFVGLGYEGINLRTEVLLGGVEAFRAALTRLHETLRQPMALPTVAAAEWLPRRNNHVGGSDLLHPGAADFWSKKEDLVAEFRVQSFLGRSIRGGKKVTREGFRPETELRHPGDAVAHPWIRSWQAGWRISYDGESVRQAHRDLAHRAVSVLGLQFGAVDIGQRADGSLLVLEVNRAPGLEGGTITAYGAAIQQWAGM